jgi:MFS transporter, DHA3 family, tetracycline resistance protein
VISMSGQVDAVGQIAGGPGVGWIGNIFSIRAALLTSAAILTPALALYVAALRKPKLKVEIDEVEIKDGGSHATGIYQRTEAERPVL